MALNLNPACRKRAVQLLTTALPKLQVTNGGYFLKHPEALALLPVDSALPGHGPMHDKLSALLGEWPLFDFINQRLSQELMDSYDYDSNAPPALLASLQQYADVAGTAQRLVDDFESLPWEYTLSLVLPETIKPLLQLAKGSYALAPDVVIKPISDDLQKQYPLTAGNQRRQKRLHGQLNRLLVADRTFTWGNDGLALQISLRGFVGAWRDSVALLEGIRTLKAFLGLGLAVDLFELESRGLTITSQPYSYMHRRVAGTNEIERIDRLDDVLSDCFGKVRPYAAYSRPDRTDEDKQRWLTTDLERLSCVFRAGEKGRRIRLAAQWLLDGILSGNELLAFVQGIVVLEVLLGEEKAANELSLSALLGNRCAYLIAESHAEREAIMKEFKELYDVRSKIVHHGKERLSYIERGQLERLRDISKRVILAEIKLLLKDQELAKKAD